MEADIIPGTVDSGVPSPPPGARRGAMVSRPRADMRCEVWAEDRTEREPVILSWRFKWSASSNQLDNN